MPPSLSGNSPMSEDDLIQKQQGGLAEDESRMNANSRHSLEAADALADIEKELGRIEGVTAMDGGKEAEYWKHRVHDLIQKNKALDDRNKELQGVNAKLEQDVRAWERRSRRMEKRAERFQGDLASIRRSRRSSVATNYEVSEKEVEEVASNPSNDLRKLMQSSFREKWSKKRLAGVEDKDDAESIGESTAAARKYVNDYLESNPQDRVINIPDMVVAAKAEKRQDAASVRTKEV